jgi:2',3'-cyclic-nucleotide 2'-phosphodiesterase
VRILFIGDIVGKPGVDIVIRRLATLRDQERIDLVIANGENAADGSGITPAIHRLLTHAGVDCITLGDHIYRRKEAQALLERETNIIKPANFPDAAPCRGWTVIRSQNGTPVAVFSLLGRVFMRPVDCPWTAADQVLKDIPATVKLRILDFHAEATSDMQLMGRYLDGRVTAVMGTHTHVPTADEEIFPGGTAFQCDVGMTGPFESILGRRIDRVMETTLSFRPTRFEVATRDLRMCATLIDADPGTGRATAVRRIVVREP